MRITNTISDSIVDGPGLRFTVFTQGCLHNCPGCHNPETHDPLGGHDETLTTLAAMMLGNPLLAGLSLSGGDPFLQADECAQLAHIAHEHGLNVWTYTGYTYEQLIRAENPHWDALLSTTDVLVDGPFIEQKKSYEALFRGSSNQRLIDLNATRQQGQLVLWSKPDSLMHFIIPES
jgi:anaerobic ribonucleoside-triphosphate reductase activating protein